MIVSCLNEILDLQFVKVKDENNYLKKLCKAFDDFATLLRENKEMLAKLQAIESGKPIKYCKIEIERCDGLLNQANAYIRYKYIIGCSGKIRSEKRIPVGIVLAVTTFSSPYSSFFHKIIPAVISGNMFIFVPSPKVCSCSKAIFTMLEQCMLTYLGEIDKRIFCVDTKLIKSDDVINQLKFDYILFTGRSETAALIKQCIGYRHGMFETGSNAMAYVDETIEDIEDIENLAKKLTYAAFAQSGMRCIGLKNLFIQEKTSELLIEQIVCQTKKIPIGNPLQSDVVVGPIYDTVIMSTLLENIAYLKKSGYQILEGGYVKNDILVPTLLLDLTEEVVSIEEMYGPVLCIHVVSDFEDIKQEYYQRSSLNTALFTKDLNEVNRFIEYCNTCGTICINCGPDKRDDKLPFGGLFDENDGKEDLETLVKELSVEQKVLFGVV